MKSMRCSRLGGIVLRRIIFHKLFEKLLFPIFFIFHTFFKLWRTHASRAKLLSLPLQLVYGDVNYDQIIDCKTYIKIYIYIYARFPLSLPKYSGQ